MEYRARLGQVIAEVRVLRGLTQEELAVRIAKSTSTVSRWEGGLTLPSAQDIRTLCDKLGVPSDLLIFPPTAPISEVQMMVRLGVAEGVRAAEEARVAPPADTLRVDKRRRPRC